MMHEIVEHSVHFLRFLIFLPSSPLHPPAQTSLAITCFIITNIEIHRIISVGFCFPFARSLSHDSTFWRGENKGKFIHLKSIN